MLALARDHWIVVECKIIYVIMCHRGRKRREEYVAKLRNVRYMRMNKEILSSCIFLRLNIHSLHLYAAVDEVKRKTQEKNFCYNAKNAESGKAQDINRTDVMDFASK